MVWCFNCAGPHYQQDCELLCVGCPNSTHAGKDCANCPVRRGSNFRGGNGGSFSQRGGRSTAPNGHYGSGTWNSGGCPVYPTMAYTPDLNMNQPGLYSYAPSSIQDTSGIHFQNNASGNPFLPGTGAAPNTHEQPVSPFRAARSEQQTPWDVLQQRLYANREHFPCSWCGDFHHCLLDCTGQLTKWRAPLRTWIVQSGYESQAAFFVAGLQERHRPDEVAPFMTARRRPHYSLTGNPDLMGVAEAQGQGRGEGRGGGDEVSGTLGRQDGTRQDGARQDGARQDGARQDGNGQPGEDQPAPQALPSTQTAFDEQRSPQHQIDESNIDMPGGVTLT